MDNSLRKTLKSFFKRGAKPTESQFAKWLDACFLNGEDGLQRGTSSLKVTTDLKVSGDLIVDGTFWLANEDKTSEQLSMVENRDSMPVGAIILWSGKQIPTGYALCDGEFGRPHLSAPQETINLYYIIKTV
ncbi:tail fiber protein [Pseudoalteromonas luteoviolacea]|uniref:Uncharacterized protein n=1 Tax=Pseudoalteromonas luteoviolacea S4054 TaxID=1129367 RepID=A0A0F6ADL5_9GAMM|nr:tail fiber protein [Pseudoalteromonas luteoviolacea]AOT08525.1 hypothetical protein S4054249_11995 [Pseudoalteromonas luteoviolacea]AOT13441.1 hypothetical protein S40542_11970 [Pseudoalteromonas luteoviolacea]AOT18354.1 hypothetical protein S4054_11970 [Pseudoalteromonas luteoviolacea]KKE83479.1 hypothetical protein N479_13995 [Pseudoalteromonas luteoviolacea S4054]KZN75916.1 hypothetical protein N481_06090 [Pseudoalteromonas luteoviolacea S4047-1]